MSDGPSDTDAGSGPAGPSGTSGPDAVGSVGDEAAKLMDALSGWARDQGSEMGGLGGLGALAGQAAEALSGVNEHLATGSAECTYCPVCRAVHAIRETSPEVKAHLATAASSLLQAGMQLLATAVPDPDPEAGSPRSRNVEPIRLDDEES